jgi:hypothetical protein
MHQHQIQLCRGAEKKIAVIWNEETKQKIMASFRSTKKPYAEDAARAVSQGLDAYAQQWVTMATEVCEAARLRQEQSEELHDLRMGCLSQRRDEFAAVAGLFTTADEKLVANAVQAIQALSDLEKCANVVALRAPIMLP